MHYAIATGIVIVATAVILSCMGRPFTYKKRVPLIWHSDFESDEGSQHIFDPYSFTHITHGIIFYFIIQAATTSSLQERRHEDGRAGSGGYFSWGVVG